MADAYAVGSSPHGRGGSETTTKPLPREPVHPRTGGADQDSTGESGPIPGSSPHGRGGSNPTLSEPHTAAVHPRTGGADQMVRV